jgi:hypothetical protein
MADYFPLLSRTIASLGNSTAEQRQIVYQRARVVVQAQLSAIDPPMSEDGIAQELELFEQSVVRLENEMLSLESLKGDADGEVGKENSTRRHISARLSDLMAKAAAARAAATQERLKSDLPVGADPALASPVVKVDAVPVPIVSSGPALGETFIGQDGEGVDHPLVPTSVIEGDPLDALAEAHIRKVSEQQESVEDSAALTLALTDTPPLDGGETAEAETAPDPVPMDSQTRSDATSSGISPPVAEHFSMIPWLSSVKISHESQDPDHASPITLSQTDLLDEHGDDPKEAEFAADGPILPAIELEAETVSSEDQSSVPEMPQVSVGLVAAAGESGSNGDEFLQSADPDAETHSKPKPTDRALVFPPLTTISATETDTEAAKAAFWGEAYQPKKDDGEDKQEADAPSAEGEATEAPNSMLMELTEDESRPRLLQKRRLDRDVVRRIVMVAVFASVTAAVGITAYILRDQPSDFEQNAGLQRSDLSRKINDRLPSDIAPQAEAAKTTTQAGQVLGQRVFFLEEVPEGQAPPPPVTGQVSWLLDTIRDSNGAGDVAVKADVKGLSGSLSSMSLSLKRNRDASFPASHLLEVTFVTPQTSQNGQVRDIGLPEMRVDETTRGAALFGLPVPVTDNVFLVGLTNLPDRIEFNIDLLRSRKWLVVPLRFANGRRAALIIEKGLAGDRALLDAFQAWK